MIVVPEILGGLFERHVTDAFDERYALDHVAFTLLGQRFEPSFFVLYELTHCGRPSSW